MLEKLLEKGYTVKVDAHSEPFLTGSNRTGWEWARSPVKGAVYKYDGIWVDRLTITGDDDFLYGQEERPRGMSTFNMMHPVDRHYAIRKVNGIWTIVDRGEVKKREPVEQLKKPVSESQDHEEFMLKMAAKKMRAAGLDTELIPRKSSTIGPKLETKTPVYSIYTFFDAGETGRDGGRPWLNAWFKDGRRAAPIGHFATVDELIKDIT